MKEFAQSTDILQEIFINTNEVSNSGSSSSQFRLRLKNLTTNKVRLCRSVQLREDDCMV